MQRLLFILSLSIACAACSSPTGIVPIGDGLYMTSKLGGMGTYNGGTVKAELYREAAVFCAKDGRKVIPVTSSSTDSIAYNSASAEVQFRCN